MDDVQCSILDVRSAGTLAPCAFLGSASGLMIANTLFSTRVWLSVRRNTSSLPPLGSCNLKAWERPCYDAILMSEFYGWTVLVVLRQVQEKNLRHGCQRGAQAETRTELKLH